MSLKTNFPDSSRIFKKSTRKLAPSKSKLKAYQNAVARHEQTKTNIREIAARLAARRHERAVIDTIPAGTHVRRIEGGVSYVAQGAKGRFERRIVKF